MDALKSSFAEIKRYPGAIVGLIIIFLLIVTAIVVVVVIPYDEAVTLWRGSEEVVYQNPKSVPPAWMNWFTKEKRPETLVMTDGDANVQKVREVNDSGNVDINYIFEFDFEYDDFPQDILLYLEGTFEEKSPFADIYWVKPDGTEVRLLSEGIDIKSTIYLSQESKLQRRLGDLAPQIGLFAIEDTDPAQVMKGTYQLRIEAIWL